MRRTLFATFASLALGLPLLAAPAAQAQTDSSAASAVPAHRHHARRHRHRHHHHGMRNQAGQGASGTESRPDLSGSTDTGTGPRNTTGAQTSLPSAVSNQAPNATAR